MAEHSKKFPESYDGKRLIILQRNEEQYQKILDKSVEKTKKVAEEKLKIENALLTTLAKLRDAGNIEEYNKQLERLKKIRAERLLFEKKLQDEINAQKQKSIDTAARYELNQFLRMNATQKREYHKKVADTIKLEIDQSNQRKKILEEDAKKQKAILDSETASDKEKNQARRKLNKIKSKIYTVDQEIEDKSNQRQQAEKNAYALRGIERLSSKARAESRKTQNQIAHEHTQDATATYKEKLAAKEDAWLKKSLATQTKLDEAKKRGDKEEVARLNKKLKAEKQQFEEELKNSGELEDIKRAQHEAQKEALKELGTTLKNNVAGAIDGVVSSLANVETIDKNLDAIFGDQAKYIAKLQGSTEDWRESVDNVSDAIGFSGIVSKKNVIGKMKDLVDSGIAYNIEMRAFLAETSANIASTFEATNGTLLRMIRLQQQDSTAARLGMEASLTRLFNDYFKDTTYLKDAADNISTAILDASATMTRDMSVEFEYTMQKWLGSLYSLGMSSTAITSIAQGINYLGTGNITSLSGNSSLQTLLAMGAARSGGKSYSDLLNSGLTSEDTNNLLRGIIEYLAEIATSQDNMVTKSAYAELFGMSVTDLSTFASLTTSEIESLYKNTVSYQSLVEETSTRLSQIAGNMSLSDLVDTAIDNAQVGVATTIGSNAFTYGTWKALGLLKEYVGEINIPSVLAAGFGLSSDIDLINVAQTGMVGIGMLGSLIGGISSMFNGGVTNLDNWDFNETTQRGGGLALLDTGAMKKTSYSAMIGVGSSSSSDVESVSLQSATNTAYNNAGTTSEEAQEKAQIPEKIYNALDGEDSDNTIVGLLTTIRDYVAPERVFYSALVGSLDSTAAERVLQLSAQVSAAGYTAGVTTDTTVSTDTTSSSIKSTNANSVSGSGSHVSDTSLSESMGITDLYQIIQDAVTAALGNYSSIGGSSRLQVSVLQ